MAKSLFDELMEGVTKPPAPTKPGEQPPAKPPEPAPTKPAAEPGAGEAEPDDDAPDAAPAAAGGAKRQFHEYDATFVKHAEKQKRKAAEKGD